MNIIFISIAWPQSGEKNLYTDLMDEFILHGHNVYAVGIQNSENKSGNELKIENGINVLRIVSGKIRKTNHFRKILSLLTLESKMVTGIEKNLMGVKFDLIIGTTPPITLSHLYVKLKKRYNATFYLLLKDIWPQGSVDLKVFKKYSLPWIYFRSHEIRIYKTADQIGCMSPLGVKYILSKNKFISEGKVEVCPNCIRPNPEIRKDKNEQIRYKYNIPLDSCVFIFSGNLGLGHGLGFLAEAIRALTDFPRAYFVVGGSGTHFRFLQEKLKQFSPKNVLLYEWLPREDFNEILATSDVGLILLHKYTVPQFPSRLLSYLEYSKPVLCAITRETDIGTIVENSACGRSILHGDLKEFIAEVKYFSENKDKRLSMGENGRKLLMENYTVSHGYEIIMKHFTK